LRKPLAALVMLLLAPFSALAGTVTTFEDGWTESVAELEAPQCADIINVTVPAECRIRKATMNVSAVIPDGNPDCPGSVQVLLNDTLLWRFNGTGYGGFGLQTQFINETTEWRSRMGAHGGSNNTTVRLPKGASVQNATFDINCSGREVVGCYMNLSARGMSISEAGDLNGDGAVDVILGIDNFGTGAAAVHFCGAGMDDIADLNLTGEALGDYFGFAVDGAGDLNGDGHDDIIIGAISNDAAGENAGRAYIFYGGPGMDAQADVVLPGFAAGDLFGRAVAGVGDVNLDGYDDFVVGAPNNDTDGRDAGRAYLYFGGATVDASPDIILASGANFGTFGWCADGAGDVNGDGKPDFVIGSDGAHRAYVYLGGSGLDGTAEVVLSSGAGDYFGKSVSGAGDMNGDGYDDIVVGAPMGGGALSWNGAAYVFLGGASLGGAPDLFIFGEATYNFMGESVCGAGDVNADGYADIVVGARGNGDGGTMAGKAYLFCGAATIDSVPDAVLPGPGPNTEYGALVSSAGDVDLDGLDDFAVFARDRNYFSIMRMEDGVANVTVVAGSVKAWVNPGLSNGTLRTKNFGAELDTYLRDAAQSGIDDSKNRYVDMPFSLSSGSKGNVTISGLHIAYEHETAVAEFAAPLNAYIRDHKAEADTDGNLTVPIRILSATPGRLRLEDLSINVDAAPAPTRPIPDLEMAEDTSEPELLDLYDHFKDDYDLPAQLRCTVASATNQTRLRVSVVDNRYLSADALHGTAGNNWTGESLVRLEASDQFGSRRLSNEFRIIVFNVNDAPVITSKPPETAEAGVEYQYQVAAVDGDNDTLTFSLEKPPGEMTIDPASGLVRWVPSRGGEYDIVVSASDGALSDRQSFRLTVPNRPPKIADSDVPTAYVDEQYSYAIPVSDPDSDLMAFALQSNIAGMALDPATGSLTWVPKDPGNFPVSVAVSDGIDILICDFIIKVVQRNRAPRFTSVPGTFAIAGLAYSYDADASDQDNDPLTFQGAGLPAGMALDNASGKLGWTPPAPGNFTVKLNVSDGRGGFAMQEFTITVKDRVRPKVEFTSPKEGQSVRGKLVISGKAIKGTLGIGAVQVRVDGDEWANASGNSTWTFTLDTTKLRNGRHTIEARAYDGMDYSDTVSRSFIVDNPKSGGKGFIPGFDALPLLIAAAALLVLRRKMK